LRKIHSDGNYPSTRAPGNCDMTTTTKLNRRKLLRLAAGAAVVPSLSRTATAQAAYPTRPVRLIVGFSPGSAADVTARIFAQGAAPLLGQQIVVENKTGAGSSISGEYAARAGKDGYTLFLATLSIVTTQIIHPDPGFDLIRDFAPIAALAQATVVLVVNPAAKVNSLADLIALAKAKPEQALCGTAGFGSTLHFDAELFAQRAGIKLTYIPYPGSPQAMADLVAGRTVMMFAPVSTVIGQIAAGKLVALATASNRRSPVLPAVPTMAELGIADFDAGLWVGLEAPAGTPQGIIEKMAGAAQQAMHSPQAVATLEQQGFVPLEGGPDEFDRFIRGEIARWTEVARLAGMTG
jgi:tripartite-type tricarboxylate transporter receptor subunit TctC